MAIATSTALLTEIRSGKRTSSFIPVNPRVGLGEGDTVEFREATFDGFGIPTFVDNGALVSVTLSDAWNTEFKWCGNVIFGAKWKKP